MMPRNAATAPGTPRSWSPTRMLTLVELSPGRVWPISSAETNSSSFSHRRCPTSTERRYATIPPPKLTEPMTKNVEKMTARLGRGRAARVSFMMPGRVLSEAVDDGGLGNPEREPGVGRRLDPHEELVGALARLLVLLLVTREPHLVPELRDQGGADRVPPPHRQIGLGLDTVPEVEHADRLHQLRHPRLLHHRELGTLPFEHLAQDREHAQHVRDARVEMRR